MKYIIMRFIIIIYLLLMICNADKPRLWTRINDGLVGHKIIDFLNINRINNCFEYVESPTYLKLKCWRDNQLTDVNLKILNNKRESEKIHFYIENAAAIWV